MATYVVEPENRLVQKVIEANSARRAAEHGAERMLDEGHLKEWPGGIRKIHVRNLAKAPKYRRAWVFEVMLSQPGDRFDVVGEVAVDVRENGGSVTP